jgi:tight adherence protein B
MTAAPFLAAGAAALGVLAAWDALAALEPAGLPAALMRSLDPLLRAGREGHDPSPPERRRLALLAAGVLFVGGWIVAGPLAGAALATLGPWLAVTGVRARRSRYRAELRRAAPTVARALADSLAAGHAIRGALAAAAEHVDGPAGAELAAARGALAAGARTEDVLARLRERAGGAAWNGIVAAILLHREAGGDLGSLLRRLAAAHEQALRLEQDARSATAQARFTGWLVCGLPVGAALLAELAHPGYLAGIARSPLAAWLACCALACQAGSLLAIRRIARVRER